MRYRILASSIGGALLMSCLAFSSSAGAETPPQWNCTGDDDCSNPDTPYCDLESGNCVECLDEAHCDDEHLCHEFTCIPQCFDDIDCAEPTPHCSDEGLCLECLEDADCPDDLPQCIEEEGVCGECSIDEDCPAEAPVCAPWSWECVECIEHTDCAEEQFCSNLACVPDICVPGERECSDESTFVLECSEHGGSLINVEACAPGICVEGACEDLEGTEPGETETTPTPPGTDGGNADGDAQAAARGCGCGLDGDGSNATWLALIALMGVRRRIRNRRPGR